MNLKVLFVVPGEKDSASFIFAKREIAYLHSLGIFGETYYFQHDRGLRGFFKAFQEIRKKIKNENFNILHSHFGTQTGFLCLLAKNSAKLVITFRGSDLNWNPHLTFIRNMSGKFLSLLSMRFANASILVSKSMAPNFSQLCRNVSVIPTGIDTSIFFPMDVIDAKRKLQWDDKKIHLILNAGRESKNKRLDLAEGCHRALLMDGWPVELHVMRGDVAPSDVPLWMNAADVLLMLSDKEGSPTVVQEALACGTPIVSVLVGDIAERLPNVTNARIVSRELDAIIFAIKDLKPYAHQKNSSAVGAVDFRETCAKVKRIYQSLINYC